MKREPDFFKDQDLDLIYVAKRLKEALALEKMLTERSLDYLVEPDHYVGGIIFRTTRVGAFFYVLPEALDSARLMLREGGYKPYSSE
ncbi:MAG: hypothetical protein NTY38_12350 [Acidobacteria bacterium]|nr:hypothetical protein [Acidobacteriota bacterium]